MQTFQFQPPNIEITSSSSQLLAGSDFVYLGAFRFPNISGNGSAYATAGCAFRRVGGQKRIFSGGHVFDNGRIYEVVVPSSLHIGSSGHPTASLSREWGNIYGSKKTVPGGGELWTHGLNWDESRGGLWWSYGHKYHTIWDNYPCLGFSSLNDSNGASTPHGPYTLTVSHTNAARTGTMFVPQWFADQYAGGRRLWVGGGGAYSGQDTCSSGLHTVALNSVATGTQAQNVGGIVATDCPWSSFRNNGEYNQPQYLQRRDNGYSTSSGWGYPGGYMTAGDCLCNAVFVERNGKHGILSAGAIANGSVSYQPGGLVVSSRKHAMFIFDPAHIGEAALGQRLPHSVIPTQFDLPNVPQANDVSAVSGMAYDLVDGRLYIQSARGTSSGEPSPLCHVYVVN